MIPKHWPLRPVYVSDWQFRTNDDESWTFTDRDGSDARFTNWADVIREHDRRVTEAQDIRAKAVAEWAAQCFRLAMESGDLDLSRVELRGVDGRVEFRVRTKAGGP